jgi:hypothetical protein
VHTTCFRRDLYRTHTALLWAKNLIGNNLTATHPESCSMIDKINTWLDGCLFQSLSAGDIKV